MRFLHLSDLHIGKRVNGFSMLEDQRYILDQLLSLCRESRPDAVVLAGDVYDRAVPPAEATSVLDDFLTELVRLSIPCLVISGNHDSGERLGFGGRILRERGVYLCGRYQGTLESVVLEDQWGPVRFWLMPFLRPADVRPWVSEQELASYEDAVRAALETAVLDPAERHVLVAHQFVTGGGEGPRTADSETPSVGGVDQVGVDCFAGFHYVALGHLHGPQSIGRPEVRYGGSPLKYSFSEARQVKSAALVTLGENGEAYVELHPLIPLRDMREIRGPIQELTDPAVYAAANTQDYIHATLTDEEIVVDALGKLRAVYPNLMKLEFDNARTQLVQDPGVVEHAEHKAPLELFREFYEKQNNVPLDRTREDVVRAVLEELEGSET